MPPTSIMILTNLYYLYEKGAKKNQEDFIWPAPGTAVSENRVFIVCDGVGGSENGEIASRIIAEYTGNYLLQTPPASISTVYVNNLLAAAKEKLINYAQTEGLNKDMATTFALLVLFNDKAFICWCGDSRVYHIRNGDILYQTMDHSLVNTLVRNGEITEAEASVHPKKHFILKAITGDDTVSEADGHWITDLAEGDYFLLCTDGILENVTASDLKQWLTNPGMPNVDTLMQEKCRGKTRDNYSMYLVQVSLRMVPPKKRPKGKPRVLWMLLVALLLVASGLLFYFNRSGGMPVRSFPVGQDTGTIAQPDTVLIPGKNNAVAPADTDTTAKEIKNSGSADSGQVSRGKQLTHADSNHASQLPAGKKNVKRAKDSSAHGSQQ